MPRVSVVIPTYNRAALVRESIDSVLRQGYRDREIIVVDDGSTDDTPAVAGDYAGRITYLRQPNRGVNAARNAALAVARGDFIALLDSDDLYLPFALELMTALLDHFPDAGFAYTDFSVLREGQKPCGSGLRLWHGAGHRWDAVFRDHWRYRDLGLPMPEAVAAGDFDVYRGDIYPASLHGPQVPPCTSLIRRSSMGELRFPEFDSLCGDWDFFARLSKRAGCIYADVPAALNRSHEDEVRLTRTAPAIRFEKRVALIDRLWRQDPEFLARQGAAVDAVQFDQLLGLARSLLLSGEIGRAREALARAAPMRRSRRTLHWLVLRIAARVPGAAMTLRAMRHLRRLAWRLRHGQSR